MLRQKTYLQSNSYVQNAADLTLMSILYVAGPNNAGMSWNAMAVQTLLTHLRFHKHGVFYTIN